MPDKHAILSASSANRWLHCTPSARLEDGIADQASAFAAEGTVAHAKGEEKLNNWLAGHGRKKVKCEDGEMDEATTDYRNYVIEVFNEEKDRCPDAKLFVEVQEDLSKWIPEGFGTSDAVIVSDNTLHVIDLKYGKGVAVNATDNPQLKLYAAGAMNIYEMLYDFNKVKLHIFQPRIDNINTYELTTDELHAWLEQEVKPKAQLAFNGEGTTQPGEWCRFCKVKSQCKARAKRNLEIADQEKRLKALLLTDDEVADLLPQMKEIQEWCKDVQEFALNQAMQGTKYKGFKMVEGTSRRKITDQNDALEKLQRAGFEYTAVTQTKLKGLTDLEKLVGKKAFTELMGDTIEKPPGAPTLVPENDKRPELKLQAAMEAFAEELEGAK